MLINGTEYSFQLASDVVRDGLGYECFRVTGQTTEVVLEVFRNDSLKTYTYSQWVQDLPLEFVERVLSDARKELGDFQA